MQDFQDKINNTSQLLKIIADSTRLGIICILVEEELCVKDISEKLNKSQSSISHQLRILRTANVLKTTKSGKNVIYKISDLHIKEIYDLAFKHANKCNIKR